MIRQLFHKHVLFAGHVIVIKCVPCILNLPYEPCIIQAQNEQTRQLLSYSYLPFQLYIICTLSFECLYLLLENIQNNDTIVTLELLVKFLRFVRKPLLKYDG